MNFYEVSKSFVSELHSCFWIAFLIGWIEMKFQYNLATLLGVSFVNIFAIAVFTWSSIHFSGSHFNPLITSVLLLSKRIKNYKAITHYIAQFSGFLLGLIALEIFMPVIDKKINNEDLCYGCAKVDKLFSFISIAIAEFLGGFLVAFAYYAVIIDKRANSSLYAIFIGGAYGIMNLCYGKRMTVFLNPFRYLVGAIINNYYENAVIYLFMPFFGAFYASWLFDRRILVDQPKVSEQNFNIN